MEMPNGWKRLFAWNDDKQQFVDPYKDTEELLKLSKEMANAIEKGLMYEDCPLDGPCTIYGHDEMRSALKKFKEWGNDQ